MKDFQTYFLYFAILVSVVALIVVIKEVYNIIQRKRSKNFKYYRIDFFTSSERLEYIIPAKSEDEAKQYVFDNFGDEGDSSVWILEVKDVTDKVIGGKR